MEYLHIEFRKYLAGRRKNKSFEAIFPLKSHAFQSLLSQIEPYLKKHSSILEVGCGSGYILSQLAKKGHDVYGIDMDPIAIRYAKKVLKDKNTSGKILQADGFKIPYPAKNFDLVLSTGLIEHFSKHKQILFLKEMKRVSKGMVLVSIPNANKKSIYQKFKKHSDKYIVEEENLYDLKTLCRLAGLKVIRLGGYLLVASKEFLDYELKKFYKSHKLNLPYKKYHKKHIPKLLAMEKKFSDRIRYERGFLVYVLAKV